MVGNAGIIEAEVVLISRKSDEDPRRWVYLDIGKFNGLAETMDEMIRYPIRTDCDDDVMSPCVIAGPTCDSVDVLYEKDAVSVAGQPRDRREGADRGDGRLHHDLFGRRLQRLPAAEVLRDLTLRFAAARGDREIAGSDRPRKSIARRRRDEPSHDDSIDLAVGARAPLGGALSSRRPVGAAGQRPRRAGRRRQGNRQALARSQREIGEALRLDDVAVVADRLDRLDARARAAPRARASASRLRRPAAAHQPSRRSNRKMARRRRGRFDGEGGERRRAVGVARALRRRRATP